jgi:protein TonB
MLKDLSVPIFINSPWARFFALSLLFHTFVLFGLLPKTALRTPVPDPIPVSILPQSARAPERRPEPAKSARAERSNRTYPAQAKIAKNDAPPAPSKIAKNDAPPARAQQLARAESPNKSSASKQPPPPPIAKAEEPTPTPAPRPATREEFPERAVIAERELPTLKQLLPPLSGASDFEGGGAGRVPLETKDPQYISYFTSIKRSIDANWKYPELALRYGLQGRLIVEFEILENGQMVGLRVIRSSGSALLDDEALRAIRSAAPFAPIPRWIDQKPLPITARMEYHDGRLTRPIR